MNRTETINQLENLLQEHDEACKGCGTCGEIARLRGILDNNNANNPKVQQILSKGNRMTKSEVAYLIGKDVNRKRIRKALDITDIEFQEVMVGWGFSKRSKGDGEMSKLKEFTVEEYNDLKAEGLNDEQISERKEVSSATMWSWKKKHGLIGTTLRSEPKENKTITAVISPPEANTPEPEKQPEEKPSKSHIEVMEKELKHKDEELQLLKENTVSLATYTEVKEMQRDSESGRQLYMHKYKESEEKYQKTFANLESKDQELENTREQLRKVRDYNVTCTEKIQHLEALLVMYMGEGKAE